MRLNWAMAREATLMPLAGMALGGLAHPIVAGAFYLVGVEEKVWSYLLLGHMGVAFMTMASSGVYFLILLTIAGMIYFALRYRRRPPWMYGLLGALASLPMATFMGEVLPVSASVGFVTGATSGWLGGRLAERRAANGAPDPWPAPAG